MTVSISGTNGLVFNDASSQNTSAFTGGFAFRNRLINSDMRIDQRNAGAEVNPALNNTYYLDRWSVLSTQTSKFKIGQNAGSVTPPAGYTNYLGITSLSSYSVTSTDVFEVRQNIEGFNIADLGYGAAGAATVTLSFWVRSSLTGTFGGALQNSAYNYTYPFTFTISAANTWEQKTITVVGPTSGTWLTTNGNGLRVVFGLGVGSTYSGTAGAWAGTEYHSATGATSVVGTNGATWQITGVQLEKGSTATSFDVRPYTTELQLCQRYFETLGVYVSTSAWATIVNSAAPKVVKRATPTLSVTNFGAGSGAVFTWSAPSVGDVGGGIAYQTTGNSFNASATLQMSIEL
jgi:hypothetical protein